MKRTLNEVYSSDHLDAVEARYTEVDVLEAYNTGFVAGYREGYTDAQYSLDNDSWDE